MNIIKKTVIVFFAMFSVFQVYSQPSLTPYSPDPTNDFTPTFIWGSVSGATQYQIQVATNNSFSPTITTQNVSGALTYTHSSDLPEGDIYWRVSSDYTDINTYSSYDQFVLTGAPIIAPYTPDPTPDLTPTFYWTAISGATNYQIQIDDDIGFATPIVNTSTGNTTTHTVSGATFLETTYYWRVSSNLDLNKYYSNDNFVFQKPTLISFSQDTTIDQTPTLTWNSYPSATGYQIQIDDNIAFSTPSTYNVSGGTNYTPATNLLPGKIFWRVSTNYDYSSFTIIDSFVINTNAYPDLIPFSPETVTTLTPTFQWSSVSGATDYQIQVANNVSYTTTAIDIVVPSGATNYTPPSSMLQDSYFWRVKGNATTYSPSEKLTINTAPKLTPYTPSPTPNMTPTLEWSTVSNASTYRIQIDDGVAFSTPIIDVSTSGSVTYIPNNGVLSEGAWYWRVSSNLDTDYFGTGYEDLTISRPQQTNTYNGNAITDNTPTFTWSSYPNTSDYFIQIDDDIGFTTPAYTAYTSGATSYTSNTLSSSTTFYWRFSTNHEFNSYSLIDSLRITISPELELFNGVTITELNPTFKWHTVSGATGYRIQVDTINNFTNPYYDQNTYSYSDTTYNYGTDLPIGKIYWRVSSNVNNTDFSNSDSLEIIDTMPCWYVALWGNNNNFGTAISPFDSLTTALRYARPGDTVKIAEGVYILDQYVNNFNDSLFVFGGYSTDFTYRNSDSLQTIFDGASTYGMSVSNQYVTIDGITGRNCTGSFINFSYANYSVISNSKFENCLTGIEMHEANYIKIINTIFSQNTQGVFVDYYSHNEIIISNTFTQNSTGVKCGDGEDSLIIVNNIFSFNGCGIYKSNYAKIFSDSFSYNCFYGNDTDYVDSAGIVYDGFAAINGLQNNINNISQNPLYIDTNSAAKNYHLNIGSPCADSGDTASDYANEPSPNGSRINMGAYGNTQWAVVSGIAPTISTQPQPDTMRIGDTMTFIVIASGNPTPTYQWQKNNANISGQTSDTLILNNLTISDSGWYQVVITNSVNSIVSNSVYLTTYIPVSITSTTISDTVAVGKIITMSTTASASPQPSYQWQKNGVDLAGVTNSSYTIDPSSLTDSGSYRVIVKNDFDIDTSNSSYVKVYDSIFVASLSSIDTIKTGETKTLSVSISGSGPFTYKWQKDFVDITGATNSSLVLNTVSIGDSGLYRVIITSPFEKDTSLSIHVFIPNQIVITTQPTGSTVLLASAVNLSISASGEAILKYLWIKNNIDTVSQTNNLRITNAEITDTGFYHCIVYNDFDTTKSDSVKINVQVIPVPDFLASPLSGVDTVTIVFSDNSTGTGDLYIWDYGDNTKDTFTVQTNVSHFYDKPGGYTVSLTVINQTFSLDSTLILTNYITVYAKSVSTFSGTPITGIDSLLVTFTLDSVSPDVSIWMWNYGDGIIDTFTKVTNPSHLYSKPGAYDIGLTVSGNGGIDSTIRKAFVTIYQHVKANFTSNETIGIAPMSINFVDSSTGSISSWKWDFGDGDTSSLQTPSHIYTSAGKYSVKLTITGLGGIDTLYNLDYITVHQPVVAGLVVSDTSGICPFPVQFFDSSSGTIDSWVWDFGDGDTALGQNPKHTYLHSGTYSIKLIVSGPGGIDSIEYKNLLTVYDSAKANFMVSNTTGMTPLIVTFSDSSIGDIDSWVWDFGDNTTDINKNPIHTYTKRGTYSVTLSVSGKGGSDAHKKENCVQVLNTPPKLKMISADTIIEDSLYSATIFVNDADNDLVTFALLSFPEDMIISQTTKNISWVPKNYNVGTYKIVVEGNDNFGGRDTATVDLTVLNTNDKPHIESLFFPDTVFEDTIMKASMTVSDQDLGDSLFITIEPSLWWISQQNVMSENNSWNFTFTGIPGNADTGLHQIKIIAFDKEGLFDTVSQSIYVINTNDPPETVMKKRDLAYGALQYVISGIDDFDSILTYNATITNSTRSFDSVMTNTNGIFLIYPLVDGRYFFTCKAIDKDGLADQTPYRDTINISGVTSKTWSDNSMWNMISIPTKKYESATVKSGGNILYWDESKEPGNIYQYYRRSAGISTLDAGKSYWLKKDSIVKINLQKSDLYTDSLTIVLNKDAYGWNQISSPFPYPVKWNKTQTLWEWNSSSRDYEESNGILYPWDGYWVNTSDIDTVTIIAKPHFISKSQSRISRTAYTNKSQWVFSVSLETNVNSDRNNLFGINNKARNSYDRQDRPEPPRMSSDPSLYFAHPEWKRSITKYSSDIRRRWDNKINIFQIGISAFSKDITFARMTFPGYEENTPIYLFVNVGMEDVVEYKSGKSIRLKPSSNEQYRTVFVTDNKDFLSTFPFKFNMRHPYPNPCRQKATIRYTLPYRWSANGWLNKEPYHVTITIYDARGRAVRTLIDRKSSPGTYSIIWRGKSNAGTRIASGAYFCRLVAGKYTSVKKIITLK